MRRSCAKARAGANASLAAFADAYDRAREGKSEAPKTGPAKRLDDLPEDAGHPELNRLVGALALGPAGKRAAAGFRWA